MRLVLFAMTIANLLAPVAAMKPQQASTPAVGTMATDPPWVADLAKRHQALIDRNGPGTDGVLRERLLAMLETDQNARGLGHGEPADKTGRAPAASLAQVDAQLTAQLKEVVAKDGWPTIAMVGIDASNAAMLLLTHTADHAWQLALLPDLEALADAGKIDGSSLALVIDKELVSEGKLQRYGTQFKFVDGEMEMYGVEEPAALDARRAKAFLPPEDAYKQRLVQMYHLKVGNKIVSAAK